MNKIEYRVGNLLDVEQGHIVHGCNAQGVMGAGVALAVRQKYPECFDVYQSKLDMYHAHYDPHEIPGKVCPWFQPNNGGPIKLVIWNAITQEKCGRGDERYVSYDAVERAFSRISTEIHINSTNSVPGRTGDNVEKVLNFPRIGSGLANGNWNIVERIIEESVRDSIKLICWDLPPKIQ